MSDVVGFAFIGLGLIAVATMYDKRWPNFGHTLRLSGVCLLLLTLFMVIFVGT